MGLHTLEVREGLRELASYQRKVLCRGGGWGVETCFVLQGCPHDQAVGMAGRLAVSRTFHAKIERGTRPLAVAGVTMVTILTINTRDTL